MTTKVTIDAHAGWPVEVVSIRGETGYPHSAELVVIPAGEERDFYIHTGLEIVSIKELPLKS